MEIAKYRTLSTEVLLTATQTFKQHVYLGIAEGSWKQ